MKPDDLSLEADDAPGFDEDGYTSLLDEEENEAAFEGLQDAGLSEKEAQETVDFMRPLSKEEEEILDEYPELEGLTRVDDAEHEQRLGELNKDGNKAMDRVFEDAVYGEGQMQDEEKMERKDTDHVAGTDDSGWGLRSAFRSVKRGIRKAASAPMSVARRGARLAKRGIRAPFSLVKKFVPSRDRGKARLVQNLYRKLWFEHANWLAQQDKAAGVALKPRTQYEAVSKIWAKNEIAKQRLPLNYATDPATSLGAEIMGGEIMGAWWNPFSWFQSQVNVVVNNTRDQRADMAPEEQSADAVQPGDMSTDMQDPGYNESYQEDDSYQSGDDESGDDESGWNGVRQVKAPHDPVADSLGAFTAHVLGKDLPAKDNPNVDQIVRELVVKLRAGQAISPGEIGLLSSAAKEGNVGARKVIEILKRRGAVVSGDDSGLDPWLHKLNPVYWFKSSQSKEFTDKERKAWKENAELQKQLKKQQEDLDAAERAATAAAAVEQAKAQSAATKAKLEAIAASLKGNMSGSFVGHEKPTAIASVVANALQKLNKKDTAARLYAKINEGQPLSKAELREARQIAKIIGQVKVVHGDLVADMHGAFVGACVLGGITVALDQNLKQQKAADYLAQKVASGKTLSQEERDGLARVLRGQQKLHKFTASLVSGRALAGCPKSWSRGAFIGAVKAMDPNDKKMLSAIVKLAKIGNPRAQKALEALKKTGEISGGTSVGLSLSSAFKYATAPVWLPAKGLYEGAKWTGKKLGIIKSGRPSPEQVRLQKLRAAQKRAAAAQARARAADAQNEAEYRAQQAIAAARDAEADADDAEATAKEQAMRTAEIEAAPDLTQTDDTAEGDFVGGWTDFLGKDRGAKIVKKAQEKSPAGQKIRGAAVVYRKVKAGDPKARKAIETMVAKAKTGDQQAIRDVNAMKAARIAYEAKAEAKKKMVVAQKEKARQSRMKANAKKFEALRKRFEARTAEKLARMERKRNLQKLAKLESKAAKGDPKARKLVAAKVSAAKKGDKRAEAQVQAMKLGRAVRLHGTSRRERKNMQAAQYLAKRVRAGDPKAIRQYEVIKAAAAKGNPNAKRGMERLALAGAVVATVATGVVVLPKSSKKDAKKKPVPGSPAYANLQKQVKTAKEKAAAGTATREELVASARTAQELGDKESAGTLALASSTAPSATESVKKAASTVAAAQAGNPTAKAQLDRDLTSAREGDATAINRMGQVAAARTVDAVERGEEISPAMRDAINLQERAKSGDPVAQGVLKRVSEEATGSNPSPDATAAAVYATGAAALASSLASKPKARQELMEKVNPPVPEGEQTAAKTELAEIVKRTNEGTVTPEDGQRGINLAMRLHQPRVAAEISAKAPPLDVDAMSSLPDSPLPPISGVWELLKASLKAFTFTTSDPLANYREGVATRSRDAVAVTGDCSCGWSPFSIFMKLKPALPALAMLSAPVSATAAVASLARGKKSKPEPVAKQAPPAPGKQAPAEESDVPTTAGMGADDFKAIVAKALREKKISRRDLARAVDANPVSRTNATAKKALGEQVKKFLEERKVVVSGNLDKDAVLPPKSLVDRNNPKALIEYALSVKQIEKADFNRAVDLHCGSNANANKKKEFGAKLLKFLRQRDVKVV